jgi:two-component system, chemotaxis family, protein-glutamate methylesterase/glutaminase
LAIGISTGGPKALTTMLPQLPGDLRVPVLIVQHMPPVFTKSLADDLDHRCRLRVYEAADGQPVRAGEILIAPGARQMKIERTAEGVVARITDDPPENSCRPSVDYLFRSLAAVYGAKCLAAIMTGMGNDGAAGCRLVKARGGLVAAQDEASCVVFGMPRQPIEEGIADVVAPLDRLAAEIVLLVEKGRISCR